MKKQKIPRYTANQVLNVLDGNEAYGRLASVLWQAARRADRDSPHPGTLGTRDLAIYLLTDGRRLLPKIESIYRLGGIDALIYYLDEIFGVEWR